MAVPIVGLLYRSKQSELDDLYAYAESKTILHPVRGIIPYQLFPYQRAILKAIHENDNLVIVKGRQIGMTTILSVYASWLSHRRPIWHYYGGVNRWGEREYFRRIKQFEPTKLNHTGNVFQLCFHDERHYNCISMGIPTHSNRKNVVCGTPDRKGVLKKFIDHPAHADWKVLYYPISKCQGSWDFERISSVRPYFSDEQWNREMECQFTT